MIWEKVLEAAKRRIKIEPQHANRASEVGHPCERYLVYARLNYEDRQPHSPELQLIFDEGNLQETAVISSLRQAGFEIEEMHQGTLWRDLALSGHIDGKIKIDDKWTPFEIKSSHPYLFNTVKDAESLKNHKSMIYRKWWSQIQIYMLLQNEERYLLLVKNKSNGQIKEIWFELDYEGAEDILRKIERVNAHVESKTYPDLEECPDEACPFYLICPIPKQRQAGTGIIIDAELEAMLERRAETKISRDEYEELDEAIKAKFRGHEGITECGRFQIKTTWTLEKVYTEAVIPKPRAGSWVVRIREYERSRI